MLCADVVAPAFNDLLHIGRKFLFELHPFAGPWMVKS